MVPLSDRQREVLDFIGQYIRAQGFSPSYQEILTATGLTSLSTAAHHVRTLTAYGYLNRAPGRFRALSVVDVSGAPENPLPTTQVPQIVIDKVESLLWHDASTRIDLRSAKSIREGLDELRIALGLSAGS